MHRRSYVLFVLLVALALVTPALAENASSDNAQDVPVPDLSIVPDDSADGPTLIPSVTNNPGSNLSAPEVSATEQPAPTLAAPTQVPTAAAAAPSPSATRQVTDDMLRAEVVRLTNIERTKAGLPTFDRSDALDHAAQGYAEAMQQYGCFAHTCPPEPDMAARVLHAGYPKTWSLIAENIANGFASPDAVVTGWMHSPGHRANILNPGLREIGVGLMWASTPSQPTQWVQDFAAHR